MSKRAVKNASILCDALNAIPIPKMKRHHKESADISIKSAYGYMLSAVLILRQ